MTTHQVKTISVSVERNWRDVYETIWKPEFFPRWASGMGQSALTVRFTPHNEFGVLDHYVDLEDGAVVYVPLRVIANGDGAQITLTLFRLPGMTDEKLAADAEWVQKDLATLKSLLETPFGRIGGQPTVDRIIDLFYDRMETLPEAAIIRRLHPQDLTSTRDVLKKYLAQWLGGPPIYSQERGHPRLRARHLPFRIGDEERDAWMFCMRGALEEVVTDHEAREWILEKLSGLADWMRNVGV